MNSSLVGKAKTVVLDTSIALCYLDFIVSVPELLITIATLLTTIMQVLTAVGYIVAYKKQDAKTVKLNEN